MKRTVLMLAAVLFASAARPSLQVPSQDSGAAGTWHRLLKLRTTASLMHTTAHPDDEHGGMLAWAARGEGARVSLLTLNRGESGDNAIGAELFDGLGLIRTEELLVANRYYGVDRQYFTTVIDYGFSIVNALNAASISASIASSPVPCGAVRPSSAGNAASRASRPSKNDFSFAPGGAGRRDCSSL